MTLEFEPIEVHLQGPRNYQEDTFISTTNVIAVFDGLGGHRDGDIAAKIAKHTVEKEFTSVDFSSDVIDEDLIAGIVQEAFTYVNLLRDDYEALAPGCTIAMAVLSRDSLYVAHSGDSRIYFNGERVTADHSHLGGDMTACLGGGFDEMYLEITPLPYKAGDVIAVATDGCNVLQAHQFGDPAQIERLLTLADLRDNATAVVANIIEENAS